MITLSTPRPQIALVTLSRRHRRNALDLAGFRALAGAWREIAANPEVRVAVVTGETEFSSGADLGCFPDEVAATLREGEPPEHLWGEVNHALLRDVVMPVPVVAAIEGLCLGAGMELVGATDIRIAAVSSVFALPEVRHGFIASGGSVARLPRQIGYAAAMQVLLTGDRFGADRMREWGFISEVVPEGGALTRAIEVAEQIAAHPPAGINAVKRAVGEGLRGTLTHAFEVETRISNELFAR